MSRSATRRRVWSLAVLAALLAALGVVVAAKWGFPPAAGAGPAGPAVPREPWSKPWSDAPVLLVGIGDSITSGVGAPPGRGYFDRLAANPEGEFPELQGISLRAVFPSLRTLNLSMPGSTSIEHFEVQLPRLEKVPADVQGIVVLTTGGNDLIHDYGRSPPREGAMYGAALDQARPWIAAFERRLEALLGGIRERFPGGCRIFLADIYDPTDGVGDIESAGLPPWRDGLAILEAYNGILRRAAERHEDVRLVPLHGTFLGHGIHSAQFWRKRYRREDPHYWYWINLEDPNERGYDAIRRLFLLEIARAFGKLP